jgi:thymidine kinase
MIDRTQFGRKLRPGSLEIITGCMFSGKTEELIRQLRRAEIAKLRFQTFKPEIDVRYSDDNVASHNRTLFPSIRVKTAAEIYERVDRRVDMVAVDEGQFFETELLDVVTELAGAGKRVVVAGLDTDWRGLPFGPMPQLLAMADVITKLHAICSVCGEPATRTQRLVPTAGDVLVGSNDAYEARCRNHFDPELPLRLARVGQSHEAKTEATWTT